MTAITAADHHDCLATCQNHRADLSAEEFHLLNLVASAWACDEFDWATEGQLFEARRIIDRARETNR